MCTSKWTDGVDFEGAEVVATRPDFFDESENYLLGQNQDHDAVAAEETDADGEVLSQMLRRYLGDTESELGRWLLSRSEDEVLISIRPQRMFSWDYRDRMSEAGAA